MKVRHKYQGHHRHKGHTEGHLLILGDAIKRPAKVRGHPIMIYQFGVGRQVFERSLFPDKFMVPGLLTDIPAHLSPLKESPSQTPRSPPSQRSSRRAPPYPNRRRHKKASSGMHYCGISVTFGPNMFGPRILKRNSHCFTIFPEW